MTKSLSLAKLTFLIAILTSVGQMTQTMYVPSIASMAKELLVEPSALQAVMAFFLIPYGFSQLIYGPVSDRIGRKPIIVAGLVIYILGTLLSLFSREYSWFLIGSFIQGLGIGCGGVMCRTLPRDCFSGPDLHRVNSLISMCVIFSPLIAPLLGGYLSDTFGWRSSYLFLTIFSIGVVLAMMTNMIETLPVERRKPESVYTSYKTVLSEKRFQGYLICLVATFSGVAVFEAASGVLFGGVLHYSATAVSLLFVVPIPGYLIGASICSKIAQRFGNNAALYVGLGAIIAGALVILIPGIMGETNAPTLVSGAVLYFFGGGILYPAATTGAISPFPRHAGTAGAMLGGMQNLGAGLVALIASLLPADNQMPVGAIMLAMALLAAFGIWRSTGDADSPSDEPALA
ncbi:multidrug efflux MFS transporter EmrD [Vibrio sp. S4M6]|uniref:multidrug efflux MFS transporter EmrD n=1 Tax=Vibrio sinus TaxID=2946865 RepID=UPI002029EA84|nr:multidrug efflux MFS transporter EmrD [Vibrio sinus]